MGGTAALHLECVMDSASPATILSKGRWSAHHQRQFFLKEGGQSLSFGFSPNLAQTQLRGRFLRIWRYWLQDQ